MMLWRIPYVSNSAFLAFLFLGGVFGRMLGREAEEVFVLPNADLERVQAADWSSEYFGVGHPTGSHLESINPSGRSGRWEWEEDVESRIVRHRINTRHFDISTLTIPPVPSLDYEKAVVKRENLEWMLRHIFVYPRSHVTNETAKEAIRKFITDSFTFDARLVVNMQHFQPYQFLQIYEGSTIPTGINIIGLLRGIEWGTENDRPIVVGAHWDTVDFTPGTDDNGSGVSAMLEAARAIAQFGCTPKYSIIFVAFDLEEVGSQGSSMFIKNYLMNVLKKEYPGETRMAKFQGAFIMDTIMNFNTTMGSQDFPTDWSLVVPEVYGEVRDEGSRGNFLAMIYRKDVDGYLADKLRYHWQASYYEPRFMLKPFPLHLGEHLPDMDTLISHINLLRSDHSRFWYMNDSSVPESLKAVLLTDTGPYRGNMKRCYHTICDGPEVSMYENPDNLKFLTKITQVMADTLVDLSECSRTHGERKFSQVLRNSSSRKSSLLKNILGIFKWSPFVT